MLTFEQMLTPIWDTDIVYGESLTMIKQPNGLCEAPLLFEAEEVIEVCSADCKNVYKQDIDYVLCNNKLRVLNGSTIPFFEEREIYSEHELLPGCFPCCDGYLLHGEGSFFHDKQICVTYRCKKGQWQGVRPCSASNRLKNTFSKLKNGNRLDILLYGDSISHGANASYLSNREPYQKPYGELFCEGLSRKYKSGIHFINSSVSGKDTAWGIQNVDNIVNDYFPDLVFLAFGMNDGWRTPVEFAKNIENIIEIVLKNKYNTEFVLVATSTPNPLLTADEAKYYGNQILFKKELDKIAEKYEGVAVADITGMQAFLHKKKRFIDTTGNNVNHPNDFFHRLYAQYLLEMFSE